MNCLVAVVLPATLFTLLTISNAGDVGDSCQTPNNTAGTCRSLSNCPEILSLVQLREKPSWVAGYLKQSQCGFVGRMPAVCCHDPETPVAHRNVALINPSDCGVSTNERIIGGNMGFKYKWMAVLNYAFNRTFQDRCAGSLITDQFVLTAAHCINRNLRQVRLGEYDVRTDPDCHSPIPGIAVCSDLVQNFTITRTWIHPNYSSTSIVNDIALIQLDRPATLSEYVMPICLPVEETNLDGKTMTIAGWGVTEKNVTSPVLLHTTIPTMSLERCQAAFTRGRIALPLSDNQICAGGDGFRDACGGDGGAPMFAGTGGKFTQYGIVSYGAKQCGTPGVPSIFTSVSKYMTWILGTVVE